MSLPGNLYNKIYNKCCGVHPNLLPWHFQWLGAKDLYADLRRILRRLKGRILDVGCGDKPYMSWLGSADEYIGIDIYDGLKVDILVDYAKPWPLQANSFDVILCTQVLEHVLEIEEMLARMTQVLKPGGVLIVTTPFIYNEHGSPNDYFRFSTHGLQSLLTGQYEILEAKTVGKLGSVVGILFLNWLEATTNQFKLLRFMKGLLLPLWILFCSFVNGLGWVIDKADPTSAFYCNVFLVARKRL